MKMNLTFEDNADCKKGNSIYNKYHQYLEDKTLVLSETGLSVDLENLMKGSTPVINALMKQLDDDTNFNYIDLVRYYDDISKPFPISTISKIVVESNRNRNTEFLCTAICKKIASDAYNGNSDISTILYRVNKWGDIFAQESRALGLSTPIYNPEVMIRVVAINVMVDILLTFIPATEMVKVVNILKYWNDIPMCAHRIPAAKYEYSGRHCKFPSNLKLILDEEDTKYQKTRFIFSFHELQNLYTQFTDVPSFVRYHSIISEYRDPLLTKFVIEKLDKLSKGNHYAEYCEKYEEEILERCGSLLEEPV